MEKETVYSESQESAPKPDLIVDMIRHGENTYGTQMVEHMNKLEEDHQGDLSEVKKMVRVDKSVEDETEQMEGHLTELGKEQLQKAAQKLIEVIDRDNEIVAIVSGPRTRHKKSAQVLEASLKEAGIDVHVRDQSHESLVDVKNIGWVSFVEYILQHRKDLPVDLEKFWDSMYADADLRTDMASEGFESLEEISKRTADFVELLRRFTRRYQSKFQKKEEKQKTLRVVAITSDINLEQVTQKDIPMEEREQTWFQNAEIVEINIWNDQNGDQKKEEISTLYEPNK